jgi:predicted outer membrane protein
MNVSLRRAACSLAVLFGSAALLLAQQAAQPTQPRAGQQRVQPDRPGQPGQPDQFGRSGQGGAQAQQLEPSIVTLLIIDNNKEIALGQLGQQTSQNEHVKHFCEMIVEDHSNFVQKLHERTAGGGQAPGLGFGAPARERGAATPPRSLSPTAGTQPGAASRDATQPQRDATAQQERDQPAQEQTEVAATQDRNLKQPTREARTAQRQAGESGQRITVAKPVIGNQPGAELLRLHQEVAEKCLDSARQDAEKLGQEFDIHFVGAQIVAHKEMLDKLQVFQQHVSPETRQLLADAQKTTQKHLEEAKSIHENMNKQGGREGAESRRGERTKKGQERE